MPDWIIVILLGIVEGITEFIPISSTGHLLLTENLLKLTGGLSSDHWLAQGGAPKDLFNVVIQSGAVLAVLPLFSARLRQFFFQWREPATRDYLLKIITAFVITGAGGFILDKQGLKLPDSSLPVAIALLVGGVLFVVIERVLAGKTLSDEVTWGIAVAVGAGQLIAAVFPGTSRSGATILLALMFGLNRPRAAEYSFLVGIPTMLAAGGLKIFKAVHHSVSMPEGYWTMVLLGTVIAAVISFIAVKWLLRFVQTHTFTAFGYYRIALAMLILLLMFSHRA